MRIVRFKEETLSGYLEISVHIFECFFNWRESHLRGFFRHRLSVGISHPGIKSLRGKIYMICSRIDTFYFCWFVFWKPRRFKGYFVNVVVGCKEQFIVKKRSRGAVTFTFRKPSSLPIRLSTLPPRTCLPPLYHFISPHPPSSPLSLVGGGGEDAVINIPACITGAPRPAPPGGQSY